MDQGGSRNLDDLSKLIKKLTKLLLSVSVFSFFFSHTSLLSFLYSYNLYFSTFPFQLFSHAIDKNYMFLFCNGLLVFVAKFSGLISGSPSSAKYNLTDEPFGNYEDVLPSKSVTVESELPFLEKEAVEEEINGALEDAAAMERREDDYLIEEEEAAAAEEEEEDQGETEKLIVEDIGQEEESGLFIAKEEEESGAFLLQDDGEIEEEYQEQEEEEEEELEELGNGMLSTEELNKKFDEFIRKMKEELRIEARQQLIMV